MNEKLYYGDPALAKKIVRAVLKGFRYMKAIPMADSEADDPSTPTTTGAFGGCVTGDSSS